MKPVMIACRKHFVIASEAKQSHAADMDLAEIASGRFAPLAMTLIYVVASTASFFHVCPSAALVGKINDLMTTGTAPELSSISPMSM